jgi:hypothetical protein
MSFFNISFNQKAVELTPPDKRYPKFIKWIQALLSQVQYNRDSTLGDYKTGSSYPLWVAGTYSRFDRVIYGQSVYESLVDNNTANPTDATYWRVYQEYFVGVDERIMYNSKVLVFEYSLNTRFETTFRQPPLQSDIYLTVNAIPDKPFEVGNQNFNSSIVYSNTSLEYVVNDYTLIGTTYNLEINVPIAVYNALAPDNLTRTNIIKNFADKYVPAGILYTIITY